MISSLHKKMTLYIGLISILSFSNQVLSQEVQTVIPYEMYGGKMIIKMIVNEQEERFIFDTGAGQSSIGYSYTKNNNLPTIDSVRVKDATSTSAVYRLTRIPSVKSPDGTLNFKGLQPIIMPEESVLIDCFNVVGILGSDMLSGTLCVIDAQSKTITLSNSTSLSNESLRYAHNFSTKDYLPIFNIIVNGQDLQVLMDSGAGGFMDLNLQDYHRLDSLQAVNVLRSGYGGQAMGLSGNIDVLHSKLVHFDDFRVGPARFKNVISETANVPYTLLGVKFLEYAKVTIDYPRRRLYYVPYNNEPIAHTFVKTNFGITVTNNKLTISNLWDGLEDGLEIGDVITHIDGQVTGNYTFCDVVGGVPALSGDKEKTLTVLKKNGKSIQVVYKKNEIKG